MAAAAVLLDFTRDIAQICRELPPPASEKVRCASTTVALPSAAPTSRFWSHRVGLPLESDYSRGFLACVVSSTAQFVSRSTAAHCCIHQCAGWRGVAARFSQQFTAGSLQTLLPSTVSPCSHLPAAGSLPAVFLHYLPSIQLIFGILSRTVDPCAHNFA